jgi:hypothetical protein
MAMPELPATWDVVVDRDRRLEASQHRLDALADLDPVAAVRENHHQLVAAESAHLAARACNLPQAMPDLDQQLVAGRMAQRVGQPT